MFRRGAALLAIVSVGALVLGGCGGGGDGTAAAPATSTTATSSTASAGPTLAASQQIVDLVNRIRDDLPGDDLPVDDPVAMAELTGQLRGYQRELTAKLDEVAAHPCVEELARRRLPLLALLANLTEAVAEGRLTDAIALGQQAQEFDSAALERDQAACKARVGYRGLDDR